MIEYAVNYFALKAELEKRNASIARVGPRKFVLARVARDYVASSYKTDAGVLQPVQDRKAEAFQSKLRLQKKRKMRTKQTAVGNEEGSSVAVPVLNTKKRPLMPYAPKRARKLLAPSRARVHLQCRFRIRCVERSFEQSAVQPLRPRLKKTGLPVETGTGGQTQRNGSRLGIIRPDARLNKHGFAHACLTRKKTAFGFRTGDMVMATVPAEKNRGLNKGRVPIRMTGNVNVQSGLANAATMQEVLHKHCRALPRADGGGDVWQTV